MHLLTSNTESCEDGEVGEGVVEEEIAEKPGTTHGTQLDFFAINSNAISDDVVFDRWSTGMKTHVLRRVSPMKALREFLEEAQV